MKSKLISIIVPNYNHSQYLKQRLDSIFNQTYQNFEVILLDDASSDNSVKVLKSYQKDSRVTHFVVNSINSGSPFLQWDKGIKLAKGEYIWIAESDDFCEENFLKQQIQLHEKYNNAALTYCQSFRVDTEGQITGNWITHTSRFKPNIFSGSFSMNGNEFIQKYLVYKNVIPNVSAVLFKSENIKNLLPLTFKPCLKYNADWLYYIQLLCHSELAFVSEPLNYFRYHNKSVISKADKETHWLKVYTKELRAKKLMSNYLKKCKPENLTEIEKEFQNGNMELKKLIFRRIIKNLKRKFNFYKIK